MLSLNSCATLFTGTKDKITFNSNPAGVAVFIDGIKLCETPCTTSVKRSINNKDVEFRLDGWKTQIVTLDKEFNVISLLNLTGMVGWIVDAATGSIFKYDRKLYEIDMEVEKQLSMGNIRQIDINTVDKTVEVELVKK